MFASSTQVDDHPGHYDAHHALIVALRAAGHFDALQARVTFYLSHFLRINFFRSFSETFPHLFLSNRTFSAEFLPYVFSNPRTHVPDIYF
jgi:hypothetical protein